ncbi:unnamed protein product [Leptidea sinapis]|uniref:Phorbol-ester/DAG-type domain-containing protein n=1 Tax=Leptidea sinapis TaxID=189913 RepID=A0A5E4QZH6_9NEOP|nr:unnamed protein product [Leptidea sinapis]
MDGIKCNKCNVILHKLCSSPDARNNPKWMCKACKVKHAKASPAKENPPAQRKDDNKIYQDVEQQPELSLVHEIKMLRSELSSFRSEMSRLSALVSTLSTRLDSVEERVSQLEDASCSLEAANEQVLQNRKCIEVLQQQIDVCDQHNLLNDVEITGVNENSAENLLHVTITLAQKVGITIDERDIVNVYRRGARRMTESNTGEHARARPIVMRLTRRHLRDELLHAARVRRVADTSGTGVGEQSRRFYINEVAHESKSFLFRAGKARKK